VNLNIRLSRDSINHAIAELKKAKDNLQYGMEQTVEILTKEGGDVAKSHTGGMANITTTMVKNTTGQIAESGKAALIAEFGAGDATIMATMFENYPDTAIFPGSYSLLVGKRQYWDYGRWYFGGKRFTEIQPRQGLYYAKLHIMGMATNVAQGVIKL
jgi:hypothetical protein